MSLIFFEGFEDGSNMRWDVSLPGVAASSGVGPSGAYYGTVPATVTKFLDPADEHDTITLGVRWFVTSGSCQINFKSDAGTTIHMILDIVVGNQLKVRRGDGTTLASNVGTVIAANTWYYIEFKAKLHDTTGTYEVRLNESVVYSATGVDTKNGGTKTVFDTVTFINGGGATRVDDIYINNGAGSVNNSFLGDVVVEGIIPTGDGASSQFVGSDGNSTSNYQLVDDMLMTDYVESPTSGNVDTYGMGDLTRTSGSIYGVMVSALAQKTDAGARGLKPVIRRSGTTYDGAEHTLAQTADLTWDIWETDPSTSALWTVAGVNAMEAGVKVGT
jgi:hypothetical protein